MSLKDKRIVIAGGSGFLGVSMASHFTSADAKVTVLSRSKSNVKGDWEYATWDGRTLGDWQSLLNGIDAVVNLAGRSVNCTKTPDHQDEIWWSRVESTRVLGAAMRTAIAPPRVWVQMSTAHIYGDPPKAVCDENSSEGIGFAPAVGRAWETAFRESKLPSQRAVIMRTSFVVGRNRGAGREFLPKLMLRRLRDCPKSHFKLQRGN